VTPSRRLFDVQGEERDTPLVRKGNVTKVFRRPVFGFPSDVKRAIGTSKRATAIDVTHRAIRRPRCIEKIQSDDTGQRQW